jgi:pantoate--beta-alanine ligase
VIAGTIEKALQINGFNGNAAPGMLKVIKKVALMQRFSLARRQTGARIGFVPTMGYLHEGHLSLMHRARSAVGRDGTVVTSIYVNPAQFAPTEDLSRYPRDFQRDLDLCQHAGVDVIFFPSDAEMYPGKAEGRYSTYVVEESLSRTMEGGSRPSHFRGVTTIVAKLFNVVLPDVAVFGAKDFQQAAIIQRMVSDLNFPLKVIVAPTVREPDGLALSSRNKFLDAEQRQQATCLWEALQSARKLVTSSPAKAETLRKKLMTNIEAHPAARVDYIEFFDPLTLHPVQRVTRGTHMAVAVFIGNTRLIDNARL